MSSRRIFLQRSLALSTSGLLTGSIVGCTSISQPTSAATGQPKSPVTMQHPGIGNKGSGVNASVPQDIFDAATLDFDFWVKPRTITVHRQATGEKATLLYWQDGEIQDAAYQQLCHLLRDVQRNVSVAMDPKLLEILWATQAFVARYGMTAPIEILSGYRTVETNRQLIEQGVPAARKSLHTEGRAADIRITNLNAEVLGSLVSSFRQGGVGFYYRQSAQGGWIHADTGLQRSWKG